MAYMYIDVCEEKIKCKYHYQTKPEAIMRASDIANELSKRDCHEIILHIKETSDVIPMKLWCVEGIGIRTRYETEADHIGKSRPKQS